MNNITLRQGYRNSGKRQRTEIIFALGKYDERRMMGASTDRAFNYAVGWLAVGLSVTLGTARMLLRDALEERKISPDPLIVP